MSFRQTQLGRSTTLQNILLGACGSILLAACGGGSSSNSGGGTVTTQSYTVGGAVSGLSGSGLVLQDNGGDDKAVSASGTFTFATSVASGLTYNVTVKTQPASPAQTCTVTNGSGTIASANVTNVTVTCTTPGFTVGGTVSGLTGSGLVLEDNSGDDKSVSANGPFTFATSLAAAATYQVTVKTQPTSPAQTCSVANASGTIGSANVTNVAVTCATGSAQIGGTVSGLSGTGLVLEDNGGDNLTLGTNGLFHFATKVAAGATYAVTVLTQPTATPAVFCTVSAGSGTAGSTDVSNVAVTCRKTGRFIFATVGHSTAGGLISMFTIDPATGIPSRQLRQTAGSIYPWGISLDTSGPYAYVAYANDPSVQIRSQTLNPGAPSITGNDFVDLGTNAEMLAAVTDPAAPYVYFGGAPDYTHSTGGIFGYGVAMGNGTLSPAVPEADMDGGWPYNLAIDPAGKLLFAPQPVSGSPETTLPGTPNGEVWVFQISSSDGSLTAANGGAPVTYQSGGTTNTPFGVAVDPNGGFVYFTDDTGNTVTAYSYTAAGALTEVGTPQAVGSKPTGVAIDPTGQFLYVTNSVDATVSAFTINATTGALTAVGTAIATGAATSPVSPTAIQVDPSGQFVYVADGDDGTIAAFTINRATGALTLVGSVANDGQSVGGNDTGYGASALAID